MSSPNQSSTEAKGLPPTGIIPRPPCQLRSLPIRYRWEVTRRHPDYQIWWKTARAYHRNEPVSSPAESLLRQAAIVILPAIGVTGEPPDPANEFEQLEADELNSAWLSGAVHPITLRGMAATLMAGLPKDTLAFLGMTFLEATCDDKENEPPRRYQAMLALITSDKAGLETYSDEPLVSVNPAASARQISEAVSALLKQWKEERDLTDRRARADKYPDYLQVWDLREGWTGATYNRTAERKLKEIAHQLRLDVSTVNNHYRSAFELIIGYPYSPELWYREFALLKLAELASQGLPRVSGHRPLKSPTRRPVPESVLTKGDEVDRGDGPVSSAAATGGDQDVAEMIVDIHTLFKEGVTDEEVAERLGLSREAIPAIAYLRERGEESFEGLRGHREQG